MISLDLMKSSEVRIAGDQSNSMRSANDGVNIHLCIFGMQKKHFAASNFTSDKISSCAYTLRK